MSSDMFQRAEFAIVCQSAYRHRRSISDLIRALRPAEHLRRILWVRVSRRYSFGVNILAGLCRICHQLAWKKRVHDALVEDAKGEMS